MCRRLSHEEGIFCGTSTGLNVVGTIELAKEIGPGKKVVTFACDSGLKYLGGHVYLRKKLRIFNLKAHEGLNTKARNFSPDLCGKIQILPVED